MKVAKRDLYILLAGLLIGAALILWLAPRVEEKVEYRDREVVKTRTITRIKERPGGGKDTEIIEEGEASKDTSLNVVKLAQKRYLLGVGASSPWSFKLEPEYSVTGGLRIAGPFIGALTVSKERVQIGVLYEF
jgi:hypothetical protein